MKSKQVAVWSEITANDAAIIRETLRVKQSVAQTTKLPSDITMVCLFGASRVELTDGSGMGFALLHFVDTKNNRFAFMASPVELQALCILCTNILKDMGCEEAVGTRQ